MKSSRAVFDHGVCLVSDGPVLEPEFAPTADTLMLGAMGTPSEFDRRKKKKYFAVFINFVQISLV